jgi:hypothetical protein
MKTNVYWSPAIMPGQSALSPYTFTKPTSVLKSLDHPLFKDVGITKCPSFINSLRNAFVVKSPVDSLIYFDDSDQQWRAQGPNNILKVRDHNHQTFTLDIPYNFICEEPLEMEFTAARYHINDFTNKTMMIEGEVDIGKYYRSTDCAFHIRHNKDRIELYKDDPLFYVKFKSNRDINFIRYDTTPELVKLLGDTVRARLSLQGKKRTLKEYYDIFVSSGYKKKIINLIKQNIID